LITETNKLISEDKLGKKEAENILSLWEKINKVFGLIIERVEKIPEEILSFAEERKTAREKKDFKASDELRERLEKLGYIIEDLKDNKYSVRKK
jgi:cysteinyl-tRNA synthetase